MTIIDIPARADFIPNESAEKDAYIHMHSLSLSISEIASGLAAFSHTLLQYDLFVAVCGVLCERESIFYFPIWC